MNLKYDSFFVQKYLRVTNPYNVPDNLCKLVREFLFITFLYILILTVASAFVFIELYTLWNFGVIALTDATWNSMFGVKDSLAQSAAIMFVLINTMALFAGAILFGRELIRKVKEKRELAYSLAQAGSVPEPEPSQFSKFIKGWYADFKNKTCTRIEYEGLEEAIEKRRNEWRY